MKTNDAGLALIKAFEGCELKAYRCPAGVWTIGYGHTSAAGEPMVRPGLTVTQAEAEAILRRDLGKYEAAVASAIKVPLNDNQFAALVSFCFNVGPGAFRESSVCSRVNERRFAEVQARLALWNKANGKVMQGLVRRRKAEAELFTASAASGKATDAPKPVPAPIPPPPDIEPVDPVSAPSETHPLASAIGWAVTALITAGAAVAAWLNLGG